MNILLISYIFPPALNPQGILSARMAKFLARLGHRVTVIAASETASFDSNHGIDNDLLNDLGIYKLIYVPDRIRNNPVIELKKRLIYHENFNYWVKNVVRSVLQLREWPEFDVIYSLGAPLASNAAGMAVKHKTRIPWVTHFSDPICLSNGLKFKSPLRNLIASSTERRLLANADGITFVNEATLLQSTGFAPRLRTKCRVIPHFYDPDLFPVDQATPKPIDGVITFSYVGSFYSHRNPFNVIKALETAAETAGGKSAKFRLNLYGSIEPAILHILQERQRPWLNIVGPVTYRESISSMLESDYLLLIDMPGKNNLFTPSKLIDYIAARHPIIGVTDHRSDSARILEGFGYPVLDPDDVPSLTDLFVNILLGKPLGLSCNHSQSAEQYAAPLVAKQLSAFLESCRQNR